MDQSNQINCEKVTKLSTKLVTKGRLKNEITMNCTRQPYSSNVGTLFGPQL